jgi:hypothetical protein
MARDHGACANAATQEHPRVLVAISGGFSAALQDARRSHLTGRILPLPPAGEGRGEGSVSLPGIPVGEKRGPTTLSAGQDARLYGRRDACRYDMRISRDELIITTSPSSQQCVSSLPSTSHSP